MPQMMPLSWLTLFLFFSILLIMFNILNYFSSYHKPTENSLKSTSTNSINWKW